ncbi:hypothetical protein M9H77_21310 [Catharanthus roseus]|uniref:Uncharacterized protein n=1 Tax=Catharanthus roseus TaxID=4058 RepID=A0ACC0ANG2_CATRO|nr:hypothetical protein M9H77_21310 [Catharanthus roseus]
MRRVDVAISSVCAAFDEHMRQFANQSTSAMVAVPSTSSSIAAAVRTSDAMRISSSTPPPPSIDTPSTSTIDPPPCPGPLVMLGIPRIFDTYTVYG